MAQQKYTLRFVTSLLNKDYIAVHQKCTALKLVCCPLYTKGTALFGYRSEKYNSEGGLYFLVLCCTAEMHIIESGDISAHNGYIAAHQTYTRLRSVCGALCPVLLPCWLLIRKAAVKSDGPDLRGAVLIQTVLLTAMAAEFKHAI